MFENLVFSPNIFVLVSFSVSLRVCVCLLLGMAPPDKRLQPETALLLLLLLLFPRALLPRNGRILFESRPREHHSNRLFGAHRAGWTRAKWGNRAPREKCDDLFWERFLNGGDF